MRNKYSYQPIVYKSVVRIILSLFFIFLAVSIIPQNTDSLGAVLQYHISAKDSINIVRTLKPLVNTLREEKKHKEASQLLHATIEYAREADRLNLLNLLGQTYIEMTDYDSAMSQYKQLLHESEIADNKRYQGFALNNIGYIFYQNNDLGKALDYHQRALAIRLKTGEEKRIGTSYNNIGLVFFHMDSLNSSLEYYMRALQLFRNAEYSLAESNVLNNIGNIYLELGNYQAALDYHGQGLKIRMRDNDQRGVGESFKNIAEIYIRSGNFIQAEIAINEGMAQARVVHSAHLIKEFYYLLYRLGNAKGDPEVALQSYINYIRIKDSLTGIESQIRIAELEIQYQSEKKEQQIKILDRDKKIAQSELRNRNYILIGIFIVFLLAIFILVLFIRQNRFKSSLKIEQEKQRLLRSQMNPHFIYNALSAIQNFILQNNPMDSVGYISEFSGLMRLVLQGSRNEMVALNEDIQLAESYLKLQKLRFNDSFNYSIRVDEKIIAELFRLPPMLSQPFIENAVEHGVRQLKSGIGNIEINYILDGELIKIEISDNGPGIKRTRNYYDKEDHRSLATTITRERLENIKKTLGINIILNISETQGGGTKVVFSIPQKLRQK